MMRTQRFALNGDWGGLPDSEAVEASAETDAADLINILDTLEVPILVVRHDFVIASFNKAAADVLGILPSDIGQAPRSVAVLAGLPRLEQQCSEVMISGVECRTDYRENDKSFIVRISPYKKGDRRIGTVLTFTDVTAFRASLNQAVYERECTKAIINTVADPLVVLGADQRIQSGNRAFYTMFGVSREETQGTSFYELANGVFELAPLRAQMREMLATSDEFQPVEVDGVVTIKGQRSLILDARPLSFPGHSERRVLLAFQDITALKQAQAAKDLRSEEDLRRSEAFLAEGQRLSLTGSFCWKVPTDEITWSEQLYRIFEIDQRVPVTLELIASRVHPEDLAMLDDMIDRARTGMSDFEYEHRLLLPDQSVKYLHLIAHGLRDKGGRLEYIGAIQDVTQRRSAEEALGKARSELAHVARIMSLATLTASIAHEVNQPLSGIVTNASTCLRMLASDPPNVDGARETARRTIRDSNRASDVITRLRALFSKKETTFESVDLNEAAREVIALCLSELQRNRVILRTELADDLPTVNGDRVQLQQVILNLLRNASEAMQSVDERPKEVLISTLRDRDSVRLAVRDAGVGLDPQVFNKLFETFYTTKADGMGIGLSISRSIIEGHHGRLWAIANDGPGATFCFSVPCA